jgi:hypothetical protein
MRNLVLACLLLPATGLAADDPKPDAALGRQLDALGLEYEVDEDGDYRILFEVGDDGARSQVVFARSPVETFGSISVREIWSAGYDAGAGALPALIANRLLAASHASKLGGWVRQGNYAMFVVKLPIDASNEQLRDAMEAAVASADEIEAELTPGLDDL